VLARVLFVAVDAGGALLASIRLARGRPTESGADQLTGVGAPVADSGQITVP
jgi:hypothetical protein